MELFQRGVRTGNLDNTIPVFSNWELIEFNEQKAIVRLINSIPSLKREIQQHITNAYHKKNACGPLNNPTWKTYNKCIDIKRNELEKKIIRGNHCLNLRKSMWFLHNNREYPFGAPPHDEGHTHPIKDAQKYLNTCNKLLQKLDKETFTQRLQEEVKKALEKEKEEMKKAVNKEYQRRKQAEEQRNYEQSIAQQERQRRKQAEEKLAQQEKKKTPKQYGKEKHPITGKMVNKCASGKERNPITGNCRKTCNKDKEEVNNKDGKCRKKCAEQQVRDLVTGRCRKNKNN